MMEIYNNEHKRIQCDVLFMFNKNNKSFIVYKDDENDILASYYRIEGDKMIISPINSEEDYDLVDEELEKWWDKDE